MNLVFCSFDTPDLAKAQKLVDAVHPHVGGLKFGLEFFSAVGPAGYAAINTYGMPVFLDLKLHDIPNTVAHAVKSLAPLQPAFVTVHASGGAAMMRAAADAAAQSGTGRAQLLAVTVLTSLDQADLRSVGQDSDVSAQVLRLARLAKESGMDGVICSPEEIASLRASLGPDFILMVPGIRPAWAAADDQKRVMTPRQARDAGASYLVIGRPITQAADPAQAAQRIAAELI